LRRKGKKEVLRREGDGGRRYYDTTGDNMIVQEIT